MKLIQFINIFQNEIHLLQFMFSIIISYCIFDMQENHIKIFESLLNFFFLKDMDM